MISATVPTGQEIYENPLNLPKILLPGLVKMGINNLHPWQLELLRTEDVLESSRNLVYLAPTSAGKTIVYVIIAFLRTVQLGRKAIVILPYISIVNEICSALQEHFADTGIRIRSFFGNESITIFEKVDFAICTIEKASAIVTALIAENRISDLGTVVVDELHLLITGERGAILESILTRLLMLSPETKIIGISASLPNQAKIVSWLDAQIYTTNFRPVPLSESIKLKDKILDFNGKIIREIDADLEKAAQLGDPDLLIPLVYEFYRNYKSILIFCATKKQCESTCLKLTKLIFTPEDADMLYRRELIINQLLSNVEEIESQESIRKGIYFHHSGLTNSEREIIESGFRNNVLLIICATSTLACGVNLPAEKVIFRTPFIGRKFLNKIEYDQMKGRAGRFGQCDRGESIVMVNSVSEFKKVLALKQNDYEEKVYVSHSKNQLLNTLLQVIVASLVTDEESLKTIECVEYLSENGFIVNEIDYKPTELGIATASSGLNPVDAVFAYSQAKLAQNGLNMNSYLHAIYYLSPWNVPGLYPNWIRFATIFHSLNEEQLRIAESVGLSSVLIMSLSQGFQSVASSSKYWSISRFYNAMILYELSNGASIFHIAYKYEIDRGIIQSLQASASGFSGMIKQFVRSLKYEFLEAILTIAQKKLIFGEEAAILELSRLRYIDRQSARNLFNAGIRTVLEVSAANEEDLIKILNLESLSNFEKVKICKNMKLHALDMINE